jgi:hypothetical protein
MRPKRQAETWLAQLAGSAVRSVKRSTVHEALEAYLADLLRHGRPDTAREAQGRFKTVIYDDLIADLQLESVTRDDFLEWRDRLLEGRQARTVDRRVRAVIAALNQALDLGHVGNPAAWKLKALADDIEESGETAVFLDSAQRKAVITAASPAAALFLRGLELTGARPRSGLLKPIIRRRKSGHSGTIRCVADRNVMGPQPRARSPSSGSPPTRPVRIAELRTT